MVSLAIAPSSTSSTTTTITWLSAMWFCLCASLVHKYNDLIGVFFSFISCFALAHGLKTFLFAGSSKEKEDTSTTTKEPSSTTTKEDTNRRVQEGRRIKHIVGLVACSLSFWYLLQSDDTNNTNTNNSNNNNAEFMALTICTGYLAFDLWYSAMNDCYPIPPPIWTIVQDAVTLTAFLVSLCCYLDLASSYHQTISLWVSYKTICFVYQLATSSSTTTTATLAKTLDSTSATTSDIKSQASTSSSNTWTVHGADYDLTSFLNQHPGGKEAVEMGRGRDCTALFESYHPFTNKHRVVLQKYRISTDDSSLLKTKGNDDNNTTTTRTNDPFYDVLKERVAAALTAQGIDPETQRTAPPLRVLYYGWIAACLVVSGYAHIKGSILGSFLFGVFGWLIGALGHDAGHFSASRSSTLNDLGVWGMSLLCNPIMWQHQHTYAHHSHTNEFDADPDLHHFHLLLRVHKRVQQQGDFYKNQTYRPFVFFAYTFVVFGTCFWIPLDMLLTGALYGIVDWTDRHRPLRAFATAAHMVAYVVIIMIVPFFTSSSWYKALASVILHLSTSGLLFGIFSQINHLNEASLDADTKTRMDSKRSKLLQNSWAAAQVETSNNFAPNSHLWHILSNGLNLQIEHHLFPSVNHSHLYRIAPVVEQTCKEYGVNYKCYRSWPEIMGATLVWLDQLAPQEGDSITADAAAVKKE